jgi:sporulation protein YlmC with PRC-barrel domain
MTINISELYGKKMISGTGHWIGEVGEVVVDLENGAVSHLLLGKIEGGKGKEMIRELFKNSIEYNRVKKVAETILVSGNQ